MLENCTILQDRYRIEKPIGQGGMGSVYLATDERFNNKVAIKETLFTDDNYLKAFQREARLLNSLKHTALPKVSDHFVDKNGQYIVMEYIAGEDLFEMIEQSGEAFPYDDVKIWANQLLDALEYLHGQENPIIHRDIKPQNLKLTPEGQVILLDFGLAKGNPTDANHQTAANSIFGYSRNYASLEQIQGTGTDPRSDIYSLAATLYNLVTGKPPADALTRVMMVLNEENDPLQPAHLIHEQVPEHFSKVLEEAMSLNANVRPQSVAEMRELLSGERATKVLTKPNTVPNKAAGASLRTQNTKVFPDNENLVSDSKQSDIPTAILSNEVISSDSIKTKIKKSDTLSEKRGITRNSGVITQSKPNQNRLFAAAGVGILLLVGSVASMVYMFSPETDTVGVSNSNVSFDSNLAVTNSTLEEGTNSNSNVNTENSNSIFTASESNTQDIPEGDGDVLKESQEKPNSVTKTKPKTKELTPLEETKTSVASGQNKQTKSSDGEVKIKGGNIITKDAKIVNGKIETDDIVINEKGVILKKAPDGSKKPMVVLTDKDLKKLNEEQKRKVREAIRKQRRIEAIRRRERDKRMRGTRPFPPPRPRPKNEPNYKKDRS